VVNLCVLRALCAKQLFVASMLSHSFLIRRKPTILPGSTAFCATCTVPVYVATCPSVVSRYLIQSAIPVQDGSCLSDAYPQAMGVPHGGASCRSLLSFCRSTVLFSVSCLVSAAHYMWMIFSSVTNRDVHSMRERCLNNIQRLADESSFQFSKTNTSVHALLSAAGTHPESELKLNGVPRTSGRRSKVSLTDFRAEAHFRFTHSVLETTGHESAEFVRVVAHMNWGANSVTLAEVISVACPVQAGLWMQWFMGQRGLDCCRHRTACRTLHCVRVWERFGRRPYLVYMLRQVTGL
jgi:hypothetical protein